MPGIVAFCVSIILLCGFQQLLDLEFLGQCSCLGHDADSNGSRHISKRLARPVGERLALTLQPLQFSFRESFLDLAFYKTIK